MSNEGWETHEELVTFILIWFGAGLRGEEIPVVSLLGLLHFWDETRFDPDLFIIVTLCGDSKEKQVSNGITCQSLIKLEVEFHSENR